MHTPGHSPGHVSLVRERDGAVIAGDAITTTRQESLISVMTQRQEVHGPPAYFTPDWFAAARSVRALAALAPSVLVSGHGIPMSGRPLHDALFRLADRFERDEVPARGRYIGSPALSDDRGTVWLPPDPFPEYWRAWPCRSLSGRGAGRPPAPPYAEGAAVGRTTHRRRFLVRIDGRGRAHRARRAPLTGYWAPVATLPPPLTHAFQPPSRARLLMPTPFSMSAPRALVCSSTQAQ